MDNILDNQVVNKAEERFATPQRQDFSLPYSLMRYITKEWSAGTYEAFKRSCKHFYAAHRLVCLYPFGLTKERLFLLLEKCLEKNLKVWIAGTLESHQNFSKLLRDVTTWSIMKLTIYDQEITYNEYMKIMDFKRLHLLDLHNTYVTEDADSSTLCSPNALLRPLKSVKKFIFPVSTHIFDNEAARSLADISLSKNLEHLLLYGIVERIDFEHFYNLAMITSVKYIYLGFYPPDLNNRFLDEIRAFDPVSLDNVTQDYSTYYTAEFKNLTVQVCFGRCCEQCNLEAVQHVCLGCSLHVCTSCRNNLDVCPDCQGQFE